MPRLPRFAPSISGNYQFQNFGWCAGPADISDVWRRDYSRTVGIPLKRNNRTDSVVQKRRIRRKDGIKIEEDLVADPKEIPSPATTGGSTVGVCSNLIKRIRPATVLSVVFVRERCPLPHGHPVLGAVAAHPAPATPSHADSARCFGWHQSPHPLCRRGPPYPGK